MGIKLSDTPNLHPDARTSAPHRPPIGWREAATIVFSSVVLTAVHYHANIHSLPQRERLLAWMGINFVVLFGVTALFIKFVLKGKLSDYGLQWGNVETWAKWSALFLFVMVFGILIAAKLGSFQSYYSYHRWAAQSASNFLLFAAGWGVYFFAWEFFFRGFMLFGLARSLGKLAIYIQMVPFVMMHYNKPALESYGAIIAGVALGLMSYRSKSFIGCWLLHWLIAVAMYAVVLFGFK
jgi:hypothetical protein